MNILPFFIIFQILVIGFIVSNLLKIKISKLEHASLSIIIGTTLFAWFQLIFTALSGYPFAIYTIIPISLLGLFIVLFKTKPRKWIKLQKKTKVSIFLFIVFWGVIFSQLLYTRMLEVKDDGWYTGGSTWGDLALHLTLTNYFSNQEVFDLTSPVYASQKLNYPFLYDFFSATLVRSGFSAQLSLALPSLALILSTLVIFYGIIMRVVNKNRAAWIFSLILLFNGGSGWLYFLEDYRSSNQNFLEFLFSMNFNYTHIYERNLHFSNIIADILLPQRSFILAMAIFSVVLLLMYELWKKKSNLKQSKELVILGLLIGSLPLIHVHTFIAASLLSGWILLLKNKTNLKSLKVLISYILLVCLVAVPQLIYMTSAENISSFINPILGWMEPEESLLIFWLKNMGIEFLFLIFGSLFFLFKVKNNSFFKALLIPSLLFFIFCNFYTLQPHIYDNIKIFMIIHIILSFVITITVMEVKSKLKFIIVPATVFLLIISGALSVFRESYQSWMFVSNEDLALAEKVIKLPINDAVYLTSDSHNHPVIMLGGKKTPMSFRGWLWTHGIDYSITEQAVASIYESKDDSSESLKELNVDYIVISNRERNQYKINENDFINKYPVALKFESTDIYAVSTRAAANTLAN